MLALGERIVKMDKPTVAVIPSPISALPSMHRRHLANALILTLLLSFLSGCVYIRLLKFKNQLHDFDDNVVVQKEEGLSLIFPKPVVRDEDFVFITESQPSRISLVSSEPKIEDWDWRFEKEIESEPGQPFSIVFRTRFEEGLLPNRFRRETARGHS